MAMKTQGTDLYVIDPENNTVINVGCVTSIDGIDSTIEQIETTCLQDLARTYEAGLATPGAATFEIRTDPRVAAHLRLHQLKQAGTMLLWAVGWSDAPGVAPTADSSGDFELPDDRSWLVFSGYMSSFPFSFAQNAHVTSSVGIQISGDVSLIPAVAS